MSTYSVVTAASTHLTAIQRPSSSIGTTHYTDADIAAINALIRNDKNVTNPVVPQSFARNGVLYVPNQGVLKVLPGDLVWVDPNGGCGIITAYSLANGGAWTAT